MSNASLVSPPGVEQSAEKARRGGGCRSWVERASANRLALVCGAGAAVPVVSATVRGIAEGWIPQGDQAMNASRAVDVFTTHTPLVGIFTSSSVSIGQVLHDPGPLQFWLLAIPARVLPAAMTALTGAMNALCVVGIVLLAQRRGGRFLAVATGGLLAIALGSLPPETLHDILNPDIGLVPLLLLVFCCWSLACGDVGVLPVTVLVASWVIQAHLSDVPVTVLLLVIAAAFFALDRRWSPSSRRPRGGWRAWVRSPPGVALLLVLVCWSFPVADQVLHTLGRGGGPGNFVLLLRVVTAHQVTVGASAGWHVLAHAVGIPPWWLRPPRLGIPRLLDALNAPPLLTQISAVAVVVCLVVLMAIGLRRRRIDVAAANALALACCLGLVVIGARTPRVNVTTLGYTTWSGCLLGMWAWLAVGWSTLMLWGARLRRLRVSAWTPSRASLAGGTVVAVGIVVALIAGPDYDHAVYGPAHAAQRSADAATSPGQTVRVDGTLVGDGYNVQGAIIYALRRRGDRVVTGLAENLDRTYAPGSAAYTADVEVLPRTAVPPPRARVVARVRIPGVTPTDYMVTVARPGCDLATVLSARKQQRDP